jgi:hypothetical protein
MVRLINQKLNVFHVETVVNNAMFDPKMAFFQKNPDHYTAFDRAAFRTAQFALSKLPRKTKRNLLFAFPAFYELIAVHAGETHAVHHKSLAYCYQQYCVPVSGQSDVVVFGIPFI